jgi:hypothetical protein
MSTQNLFAPLDLIEDSADELFVVMEKARDNSDLYKAISLQHPEMELVDVSAKNFRRICSIPELPKAVRGLQAFLETRNTGSPKTEGLFYRQTIRILEELTTILQTKDEWD